MRRERRVLVIGSGVAGLSFALRIAASAPVTIVTKKHRADSNTNYAQGGIAAVVDAADSFRAHTRDTLVAGAGLCHRKIVAMVVREGPGRIRELMDWGVEFSRSGEQLSLGREGGHSRRRIIHAEDRTGRAIEDALLHRVAEHPNVEVLDDHLVVDLLSGQDLATGQRRCAGALVLDEARGELLRVPAAITLLATGGLGRIYRHTTNPAIATGDGVAMAHRAGVTVGNLEFVQFHPTALYPAAERAVLISEAVRGEGAVLRRQSGEELLAGEHPLASLAPRDIVARAIDRVLKETGEAYVLLDTSSIPPESFERRFPNILEECLAAGVDPRTDPLPVVPAAHYACGGVVTDPDGRTSLLGLYAVGEVACTGLHGANRLASNSLLEAVVYSHRAAVSVETELAGAAPDTATGDVALKPPVEGADLSQANLLADEVRQLMWDSCGIVRSDPWLEAAEERLRQVRATAWSLLAEGGAHPDLAALRNVAESALLVVRCARDRRESRGLHYTLDHPHRDNEHHLRDTVLDRTGP